MLLDWSFRLEVSLNGPVLDHIRVILKMIFQT